MRKHGSRSRGPTMTPSASSFQWLCPHCFLWGVLGQEQARPGRWWGGWHYIGIQVDPVWQLGLAIGGPSDTGQQCPVLLPSKELGPSLHAMGLDRGTKLHVRTCPIEQAW